MKWNKGLAAKRGAENVSFEFGTTASPYFESIKEYSDCYRALVTLKVGKSGDGKTASSRGTPR
jgi:hypothetical protein